MRWILGSLLILAPNPLRNAYFGDVHVHTRYSFDAFIFAVRATPDDAYRYARGEAIVHPSGFEMQLKGGPLDFLAVTDHAMYLGILPAMADSSQPISERFAARELNAAETPEERRAAFRSVFYRSGVPEALLDLDVSRSAWKEIIASAERNYEPGRFTTFIGYEYTSGPEFQNLHRNVIFRGSNVPSLPFSRLDSQNPEELWKWMDTNRADGMEALAIPHNPNGSNGQMFRLETFDGEPFDGAYAEQRVRNEPLVEITQVKGTSDTHPLLSPDDAWADFEIFPYRIATTLPSNVPGSYVREALRNGLALEEERGFNPFRFGWIGASDTHNGAGPIEESNYFSKVGVLDGVPDRRGSVPMDTGEYRETYFNLWGASGLAGVWAEENTREAIFDAMRRKETFATTGPRIRLRFFGGFGLEDEGIAEAYAAGVPMGSELRAGGEGSPRFFVWATRDPNSGPLQRVQIIKGWIEGGRSNERVFDVACSDGLAPDHESHRCPDNGATVDLTDCSVPGDKGAAELETLWTDPTFDNRQRAFYYVRVLENPTCRWSTWDAIRAGAEPKEDLPRTIQERAWSSPIWYVPFRD